jgi:hypothetical protein
MIGRRPLSNAERARRKRAKRKHLKEAGLRAQANPEIQYIGRDLKTLHMNRHEFDALVAHNLACLSGIYVRSMTQEEREASAHLIACMGGALPSEMSTDDCQRLDEDALAWKAEVEQRRVEHEASEAERMARAAKEHHGPTYVDDETLARILDDPDHPDHPSRRQQIAAWDTGLPDWEVGEAEDE